MHAGAGGSLGEAFARYAMRDVLEADAATKHAAAKRAYTAPVLQRLGTLHDLTLSVGGSGANDGRGRGARSKTSM
jgi:hypothetical protein